MTDPSVLTDFTVETREGFRRVEFDPDVFRFKDVRILVDGERVAEMPFPKSKTPVHQVAFDLDGHEVIGVAYFVEMPTAADPQGVVYDLISKGRSLRDDAPMEDVLERAARPGKAYPWAFRLVDMSLQIAVGSAAPGLGLAVARSASELGWPGTAALGAALLAALIIATRLAADTWSRIRRRDGSVRRRAALGCAAIVGIYAAMFAVAGVVLLLLGIPGADTF